MTMATVRWRSYPPPRSLRTIDAPSSHCTPVYRKRARRDLYYRRMPCWNSHSPDIIENLKRFYANQMLDADKQAAINVFLGITDDRVITGKRLKFGGYDAWYDTKHLERPLYDTRDCSNGMCEFVDRGGGSRGMYHGGVLG